MPSLGQMRCQLTTLQFGAAERRRIARNNHRHVIGLHAAAMCCPCQRANIPADQIGIWKWTESVGLEIDSYRCQSFSNEGPDRKPSFTNGESRTRSRNKGLPEVRIQRWICAEVIPLNPNFRRVKIESGTRPS